MLKFILEIFSPARPTPGAVTRPTDSLDLCCPYCGVKFEKPPTRSQKCPSCKSKIIRRKDQQGSIILLTDAAGAEYDTREAYLNAADLCGITRQQLIALEELTEKETGTKSTIKECFWGMANAALEKALKSRNHSKAADIYQQQALMFTREGGNSKPFWKNFYKERLCHDKMISRRITSAFADGQKELNVELLGIPDCEICKSKSGQLIKIDAAIKNPPLPIEGCPRERCAACYVLKRNEEDTWDAY